MNHRKFIIKEKGKQIYISDGLVLYPIKFFNDTISCLCAKPGMKKSVITNQYDQKSQFCCHLLYYFNYCGLDLDLLDYWIRLRVHIVSELKNNKGGIDNSRLWNIVDADILNTECPCCLEKIKNNHSRQINICTECQGITHFSCYEKWAIHNKGCMLCRSGNVNDLID